MLKKHMLSCKEVAHFASDYLDKDINNTLHWKIRLHLLACASCRNFLHNLNITKKIAPQIIQKAQADINAQAILEKTKERSQKNITDNH